MRNETRRFKENLNRDHGEKLMSFSYNGREFEIRTTDHKEDHLERWGKYDMNVICGDIVALGKERLYRYADEGTDTAIIDEDNNLAVIITFEGSQIRIRTIIDRSRIWVKSGTRIFKLRKQNYNRA